MSDERDETRPFTPRHRDDDATRVGGFPAAEDDTRPHGPSGDETRVARPSDDETRVAPSYGDKSRPYGDKRRPSDDETVADPLPPATNKTSVMPPVGDDWAASRANPAWSGRAEVRAPNPATYQDADDWPNTMGREPRDRWWMPIVVGIIALILLAALAVGIYLIMQNSGGDETPAPPVVPSAAPTQTQQTPTFTPSATPSTEPTTTAPTPSPSTTNPATNAITVPALKGLPLPEAETALSNMGLSWHVILRDDDALPGTVIDSDPVEGQEVPPDTRITLVVAQGATPPATGTAGEPGLNGD
ncbi:PASTA domain-containing protein [Actinoplanes sp. TBRC 11911]|uniref:PASTA domain-containing protein n=1 Tax=Actinoplanes sp. TBRC 11911 TaxID=2729386 RepID=UPI00145DE23A|nr:PASTA domain-containing protein [Actinoplanes sp. TBRC 11911]NMO56781.1 PASTA domain-containing protein [Actinoplanes sp. TBRC 11911]